MPDSSFIHLRVHSTYSLSEGAIKMEPLIERCIAQKLPAIALTDTSNLFGAMDFSQIAAKAGIQPIIGCQIAMTLKGGDPRLKQSRFHKPQNRVERLDQIVLLAQNLQGYQNLMSLSSHAWAIAKNQGIPQVSLDFLKEHAEGLIALSGGIQGGIAQLLLSNYESAAEEMLKHLAAIFPGRFYVELTRHGLDSEAKIEPTLIDLAYRFALPLVATNEAFFLDEDMYEAHDALLCIAEGTYVLETERRKVTPHHRLKSPQEMAALFADLPEALVNTVMIAKRCGFMVEPTAPMLPAYPTEKNEVEELKLQALEGLEMRLRDLVLTNIMTSENQDEMRKVYKERLYYELDIISQMGFPGYFLIVANFIQWAKQQDIPVGPGRGSGAGSLVAWALTITDIDPIRFNLLFERFLNPERVSMPDFDIDFCQERRDEVITYVRSKFGHDRVAQIITFGKLQARAVLRDVGRVLQIPYMQVDRICKLIPNNPAHPVTLSEAIEQQVDLREIIESDATAAKLVDLGKKLEGLNRHASTHAAGVVIGDRPLRELVALYFDPRSDVPVTQFNMKDVEKAGLVKFDFLGLKTLTVIAHTIALLKKSNVQINLSQIPLDDSKTFDLLRRSETVGIFQVESGGMTDVLRRLKPTRFEELIALVALYRPGPMDDIPRYIACKNGEEKVNYLHPKLKEILQETFGVMVYQEQVMQIAQHLACYSLGSADLLRRAMGKKIKSEMDAQRVKFVQGAVERDIKEGVAHQIFDQMAKFAGYGFNKSHSAPYALITYRTAYLKANYPLEFMAALMTLDMGNIEKLNLYRQELDKMMIPLRTPDINLSQAIFSVEADQQGKLGLRYALAAIKNVGEGGMNSIVAERERSGNFRDIWDFASRIDAHVINKRQLENLIYAGAFDSLHPNRRQLIESLEMILRHASMITAERQSSQASLFGSHSSETLPNTKLVEVPEWPQLEKLQYELNAIGFYLSSHPLDGYTESFQKLSLTQSNELTKYFSHKGAESVRMAAVVVSVKERSSKTGQKYAFITLSDAVGVFEVTCFSEILSRSRSLLVPGQAVYLTATGRMDSENLRLTLTTIEPLEQKLGDIPSALEIVLTDQHGIAQIAQKLAELGKGAMQITLRILLSDKEVLINLPQRYGMSQEVVAQILNLKGVQNVLQC
ncbi:MAG: DNA polymerase III subunit alpha [Alphaproteobacteria bacterium]|nr:DNA polymerase III subunit alpha [Alphaproteobacteria bacterium]